jgi:hypothetical protein
MNGPAASDPVVDVRIAVRLARVRIALTLSTFVLAATLAPAAGSARDSSIRANDLVVFGKAKSLKYQALDEFGLNGQITARLTIIRVVHGRPPSPVLTIKYIAHSDLNEDRALRFHLRRSKDQIWLVCNEGGGRGYICR